MINNDSSNTGQRGVLYKSISFREGVRDGIPIAVGYLPMAITFGLFARSLGMPSLLILLMTATNYAGASQFVGIELMRTGASIMEIALTTFILNSRYLLMSFTVMQRLQKNASRSLRLLLAFSLTDETFTVASVRRSGVINAMYLLGLNTISYLSFLAGTFIGAYVASGLPEQVKNSMGIILYAMFIGLIVPTLKESKPTLAVVALAVAVSSAFKWLEPLSRLTSGWGIIAATISAALIGALVFPRETALKEAGEVE